MTAPQPPQPFGRDPRPAPPHDSAAGEGAAASPQSYSDPTDRHDTVPGAPTHSTTGTPHHSYEAAAQPSAYAPATGEQQAPGQPGGWSPTAPEFSNAPVAPQPAPVAATNKERPTDQHFALAASASALFVGVLQIALNVSAVGTVFRTSIASGLLLIAGLLLACGVVAGGVLVHLRNPVGPYLLGSCGGVLLLVGLADLVIAFTAGALVALLLVAIPTLLACLPPTWRHVRAGRSSSL